MADNTARLPEIESLNLSDIDISALDVRLEMSTIIPNWMPCVGYCAQDIIGCNVNCGENIGCNCNTYT